MTNREAAAWIVAAFALGQAFAPAQAQSSSSGWAIRNAIAQLCVNTVYVHFRPRNHSGTPQQMARRCWQ